MRRVEETIYLDRQDGIHDCHLFLQYIILHCMVLYFNYWLIDLLTYWVEMGGKSQHLCWLYRCTRQIGLHSILFYLKAELFCPWLQRLPVHTTSKRLQLRLLFDLVMQLLVHEFTFYKDDGIVLGHYLDHFGEESWVTGIGGRSVAVYLELRTISWQRW